MSVFNFTIGLVVRRGERTYQLERELEDGTLVFQDRLTGRPWSTTRREIWKELESGKLSVITGNSPDPAKPPGAPGNLLFTWSSLPEKHRKAVEYRSAYTNAMARLGLTRGMRREIEREIPKVAEKLQDKSPPSASSVMGWMKRFALAGGAPSALVSGHAIRPRIRRVAEKVLEICREALRTYFCTKDRPTLKQTLTFAEKKAAAAVKEGTLTEQDAKISYSLMHRLKGEIDPYALDAKRYGNAFAQNRWRYSLKGARGDRVMARYEVDHTVLDLVVICDSTGMPLGRPTLTVVVDAFSGYCTGWFLSFWGTGLAATFCALKVAIAPKEDFRKHLPSLQHEWLGMGLPEALVIDNGLEFHSPQFRQMALQLCIDLHYCAVRQPWLKPFVERALGEVLNYLPHAGRVRKSLTNELPSNPAETAAITFSDLARGLLVAFCDIHAFEINQRRLDRRYDLFKEGLELLPPALLPSGTQELEIIVSPSRELTVGNEGIVTESLRFNSHELAALRRQRGHTFKTLVKTNPENLDYVWVQDPVSKGWLQVESCQPEYTAGLSLVQHRAIRQHKKNELTRKDAIATLTRGKQELMNMWNSRTVRGRRLRGAHLRALSGLTSSHALRFGDDQGTKQAVQRVISTEEMARVSREVPHFESVNLFA
jgi:putative transposase